VWLPSFICAACDLALRPFDGVLECATCARRYEQRDLIWRFLGPSRVAELAPFIDQYRTVREKDGRRVTSAEYYRKLPSVPSDDPAAREWRVRQETYHHLLRHVLASGLQPSVILDLGAGSGWLSHRLSALGHRLVALDAIADEADGLGALRHYTTPIVAVQADFDELPLAPSQFDVVVFNGSLHYAPDPRSTLVRAHGMLAPAGVLVVMDSPMFHADHDGAAMVTEAVRRFADDYGLREIVRRGCGYLTFAALAASANALRMDAEFVPSRGSLIWRLRRQMARFRLGRQPAAFGLWVAR
jgi:SAM-dependent methyltransferase